MVKLFSESLGRIFVAISLINSQNVLEAKDFEYFVPILSVMEGTFVN